MKKALFFLLSMWIMFACSEDKEIPTVKPPIVNPDSNENPKPVEVDSIYYQLSVDGFELIAATNDSTCLFLQTDTTFAFKCLYDSCGTNRLVAYCDSTGIVERIVIDDQVVNVLHHEDKNKMDIFYKDTEGKIAWIKDVDSPYKNMSSRAEAGDVPYSAISVVNNLSHAVYTIIETYDVHKVVPVDSINIKFANKYAKKESLNMSGTVAVRLITQILGTEYKNQISNHLSTIATVIFDYSNWVVEELYGDATPILRPYASFIGGYVFDLNDIDKDKDRDELMWQTDMTLNAYVNEAKSLKNEFEVGVMVAEEGKQLNKYYNLRKSSLKYDPERVNYACSFKSLGTGKRYKFIPYLAPVSTSKYLKGMKGLLDFYKYNFSRDYLLLETKAQLTSQEDDKATIKISVENADISIKMGIIYSEHSNILEHEYKKVEYEPTFGEGLFSNNFEKEVKLENLKSGYIYYMPYIIYDDDVLNRNLYTTNSIISAVITEKDHIFYGKLDSINTIKNPITGDAIKDENVLKFKGSFDTDIKNVTEYGICYSKDDKEITTENSTVLKADSHQEGSFEVNANVTNKDKTFYYRTYIKVNDKYYYGKIEKYEESEIKLYILKKSDWIETKLNEETGKYEVIDTISANGLYDWQLYVIRGYGKDKFYRAYKWSIIKYGTRDGDKGETYDFDKEKVTENEFVLYQKYENENTNEISHAYYYFVRVINDELTEEVKYVLTHSSGRDMEDIFEGL